jgi:hypothetical protein
MDSLTQITRSDPIAALTLSTREKDTEAADRLAANIMQIAFTQLLSPFDLWRIRYRLESQGRSQELRTAVEATFGKDPERLLRSSPGLPLRPR